MTLSPHTFQRLAYILGGSLIIAVGCIGYGLYQYRQTTQHLTVARRELASTTQALETRSAALASAETTNARILGQLTAEQIRNNSFDQQISTISSTVGQLYKLSQTDKELLQKYSNVYFLNENYIPSSLATIDGQFLYPKTTPEQIHANVKSYLERMMTAATNDSVPFVVLSGYRSFDRQTSLKANYKITYGTTAANKFSADQGYSEHQLGSTVDFTTSKLGETLTGFEKTTAYTWLTNNAYKYGFVLSYPSGNTFFKFEPWHWRFVGVELATKLHNENKYFYDLDQREIDSYLVKIFD